MVSIHKRRDENSSGHLFVDTTCMSCGTCWNIAPKFFCTSQGQSAVYSQPKDSEDLVHASQALISCPVSAIGLTVPGHGGRGYFECDDMNKKIDECLVGMNA